MASVHIKKYRLAFHILILGVMISLPWLVLPLRANFEFARLLTVRSSLLVPFYLLNVYVFIPKFLNGQRYLWYVAAIVLSFMVVLFVNTQIEVFYKFSELMKAKAEELDGVRPRSYTIPLQLIFPFVLTFSIGTSFELILHSEEQRREKEEIKKEKLYSELSFLKSQINPHFLFNSLNNIYSLTQRNSKNASQAILLLSDLMRYILYDSVQKKIKLTQEIQCLKNYIALQRLRISRKESVKIDFRESGNFSAIDIEPLILIPFLENAFKHGVSYNRASLVSINLKVEASVIKFDVYNTKKRANTSSLDANGHSGIGLSNTIRRLNLCYPDRYELMINESPEYYETKLTIVV